MEERKKKKVRARPAAVLPAARPAEVKSSREPQEVQRPRAATRGGGGGACVHKTDGKLF